MGNDDRLGVLPSNGSVRTPKSASSIIVRGLVIAVVAALIDLAWVYPEHKNVALWRVGIFAGIIFGTTWLAEILSMYFERNVVHIFRTTSFDDDQLDTTSAFKRSANHR